jgi:hypothetical protein
MLAALDTVEVPDAQRKQLLAGLECVTRREHEVAVPLLIAPFEDDLFTAELTPGESQAVQEHSRGAGECDARLLPLELHDFVWEVLSNGSAHRPNGDGAAILKSAYLQRFSDGETRTRTGDTTIFSGGATSPDPPG